MAITRRQTATNSGSGGTTIDAVSPSVPLAGSLLVIHHYIGGQDTSLMAGPTGFKTAIQTSGVGSAGAAIYYKVADGTEGTTFTCSKGASTAFSAVEFFEWVADAPWVDAGIVDAVGMATGASADLTIRITASGPTSQASVLAVASVGTTQSGSYNGWTDGFADDGLAAVGGRQTSGYKLPTSIETLTTSNTWTSGGFPRACIAAFKIPTSGGGSTPATIVGATATATASADAGAVAAGAAVVGATATATADADGGTASAGATVAGEAAAVTIDADAGLASAGAVVVGSTAAATVDADAGTVAVGTAVPVTIIGATAAATADADVGEVAAGVEVVGATAEVTVAADAGTVDLEPTVAAALIAGVTAEVFVAADVGTVLTQGGVFQVGNGVGWDTVVAETWDGLRWVPAPVEALLSP